LTPWRSASPARRHSLAGVSWILPDRRLTAEIQRVLDVHPLRGADLWHVATALYLVNHLRTWTS
jgi:hypothetical protein